MFEFKYKPLRDWRFPIPFGTVQVVKLFKLAQIGNGLRYLATEAVSTYATQISSKLYIVYPIRYVRFQSFLGFGGFQSLSEL